MLQLPDAQHSRGLKLHTNPRSNTHQKAGYVILLIGRVWMVLGGGKKETTDEYVVLGGTVRIGILRYLGLGASE